MALKDVIGHERIINILRGYIKRTRLPHALLFAGDDGIGKRFTATNLAKTLNCQGIKEPHIDCCDRCPSCKKIDRLTHPDLFVVKPEGRGGQIQISCIRDLQRFLSYKPFEGRWKVAIIDDAHRLNEHSANAFLETLEEPPAMSVIILITSMPDVLLETIRSRCQRLNFSPLPIKSMIKLLKERLRDMDEERLLFISELSGGRIGYALDEDLLKQRDRMFNIFLEMFGNPAKDLWKDKKEMEAWFEGVDLWFRDLAVLKVTGDAEWLINRDLETEIRGLSNRLELEDIFNLYKEFYNIKRLLVCNLNKQITLYYLNLLLRRGTTDFMSHQAKGALM